jgi:hypothetical protein
MAVRIKIGSTSAKRKVDQVSTSSASSGGPASGGANFLPAELLGTSSSGAGGNVTGVISTAGVASTPADGTLGCRLFDLCDSSYLVRHRKKRGKSNTSGSSQPSGRGGASSGVFVPSGGMGGPGHAHGQSQSQQGGPQVEIIDGRIVIRESSLFVGPGGSTSGGDGTSTGGPVGDAGGLLGQQQGMAGSAGGEYYEEIEENVNTCATYASFSRRQSSASWGIEETRNFYRCLRQCGTEFSMMQTFFPKRTRKQLKLKFFREEKTHPDLVRRALNTGLPLDMEVFESQLSGGLGAGTLEGGALGDADGSAGDAGAGAGAGLVEGGSSAELDHSATAAAAAAAVGGGGGTGDAGAAAFGLGLGIDVSKYALDGDSVTV